MATKKITTVSLSDLYKRCPPNQMKQFLQFRDKRVEYQQRVDKYPETLPRIDWEYYRQNVRTEYVNLVEEFEKKYAELNCIFDSRHDLDLCKYYMELEKKREEVKIEVDKFKAESDERIKKLQEEIDRVNARLPYECMTMEDFCDINPDEPCFTCNGNPSFWPHTPEEQKPGPPDLPLIPTDIEGETLTDKAMLELQEKQAKEAREQEARNRGEAVTATSTTAEPKKAHKESEKKAKTQQKTAESEKQATSSEKEAESSEQAKSDDEQSDKSDDQSNSKNQKDDSGSDRDDKKK